MNYESQQDRMAFNEWETKKLDDISELRREPFLPSDKDVRPYIGLEHVGQGTLSTKRVGTSSDVISNKTIFHRGDILFGKLRPYFRKVILARFDGVCSTDFFVFKPRGKTDGKYLFYLLASKDIVDAATRTSEGTRMPRASWDFLRNISVRVPPYHLQQAIGQTLHCLDQKMEIAQQTNTTLEAIIKAIFKHWFVDFEFPNEEGKPYKSSGGAMVDSELGNIPKGWDVRPLSEVIAVNPSRELSKGTLVKKVRMTDVGAWQSWILSWQLDKYRSGPRFQNGDTLFARITPSLEHGKTAFVSFLDRDEVASGSTEFIILAPKAIRSGPYVFNLARSEHVREAAIGAMTGSSGRQRVPEALFDHLLIHVPSQWIVEMFHGIVTPLFDAVTGNAEKIRALGSIRDAILPKLMSGEMRVGRDGQTQGVS